MSDYCPQKQVTVTIQENGIIRGPDGYIVGWLNAEIEYDSDHLDPIASEFKQQTELYDSLLTQVADYIEGNDWSSDEDYSIFHAKTVVDLMLHHTWVSVNDPDNDNEDIRKYKL